MKGDKLSCLHQAFVNALVLETIALVDSFVLHRDCGIIVNEPDLFSRGVLMVERIIDASRGFMGSRVLSALLLRMTIMLSFTLPHYISSPCLFQQF